MFVGLGVRILKCLKKFELGCSPLILTVLSRDYHRRLR